MAINIEEHFQEAEKRGLFENLPGRGEPLTLKNNPYAGDQQLAHDILQNSGYLPVWIEEKQDIENAIASAQVRLARAYGSKKWALALATFRGQAARLNQQIRDFNLKAPAGSQHLFTININQTIDQCQNQ